MRVFRSAALEALALTLGVMLLAACSKPRTQLVVWVDASNALKAELKQVRVLLSEAGVEREKSFDVTSETPQKGEQSLPFSFGILAGDAVSFNLIVRAYAARDADAQPVLQQLTRTQFWQHQAVELTVKLTESDRICATEDALHGHCGMPAVAVGTTAVDASTDIDADSGSAPCPSAAAGEVCDPILRCGCQEPASCQVSDDRASCASMGMLAQGEACTRNRECTAGLACFRGACRAACRHDNDCETARQCVRTQGAHYGFCAQPCSAANGCPKGLLCSPLNVGDVHNSFCLRVEEPCSSTHDGICDEAGHGTGFCAAESDPDDCCTLPHPLGQCDVVTQCGCPADQACREVSVSAAGFLTTGCGPIGSLGIGSRCDNDAQCIKGADCTGSICKPTCDDSERGRCAAGDCHTFLDGSEPRDKAGVCWQACDWQTQAPCMPGTVCAQLGVGASCFAQGEKCPDVFLNNRVCDEKSRACKPGTDTDSDCDRDAGS